MTPSLHPLTRCCLTTLFALSVIACSSATRRPIFQLGLKVPSGSVADTSLPVSVTVAGCSSLPTLSLRHSGTEFKKVPFSGNPTSFVLTKEDIPFSRTGLAAKLVLSVQGTCTDGQTSTSLEQSVTFFPVAKVVSTPAGTIAAPELFYADGYATPPNPSTSFVGCQPKNDGGTSLVKTDTSGALIFSNDSLPFDCSLGSSFSAPRGPAGHRWMVEQGSPHGGAFSFDNTLKTYGGTLGQIDSFGVLPDGNGIAGSVNPPDPATFELTSTVFQIPGDNPLPASWSQRIHGVVLASAAGTATQVYFPHYYPGLPNEGLVGVQTLDTQGNLLNDYPLLDNVQYHNDYGPALPPVAFSQDSSVIYFPSNAIGLTTTVVACRIPPQGASSGCNGVNRVWQSVPLQGLALTLVPFGNGLLAVVCSQATWILNIGNGKVIGQGILPDGILTTGYFASGTQNDFYIMNGPAPSPNNPTPLPNEVVGVDSPTAGELFRYQLATDTLSVAVDQGGQSWIRIGSQLIQPWPSSVYRKLLQQ